MNIDSTATIHPNAILGEGCRIGQRTRIWAFSHILADAVVGADCNICDHTFIEGNVRIGDRVTVKCGVFLWDGLRVEDDVFIGPGVVFTNDKYPRSRVHPDRYPETRLRAGCSVGAGAVILPGIEIGVGAMVGAGAVVTANVPPHAIVTGNPARVSGYDVCRDAPAPAAMAQAADAGRELATGARLCALTRVCDPRGDLLAAEMGRELPFAPARLFVVHNVPSSKARGEHAHRRCHQFLVCLKGSVFVGLDNGRVREEVCLSRDQVGLHIPPMVWTVQSRYSEDAILLVAASDPYDPADYIREYDVFMQEVGS
jgi:UDP-2-acetamido-3-amino-2,3-dideoxy-glucuronate N-acetyltransferase